jgi:hypothetical protein
VAELKKFVKELPRITQTKSSLTAHVNLADHISKVGKEKVLSLATRSENTASNQNNLFLLPDKGKEQRYHFRGLGSGNEHRQWAGHVEYVSEEQVCSDAGADYLRLSPFTSIHHFPEAIATVEGLIYRQYPSTVVLRLLCLLRSGSGTARSFSIPRGFLLRLVSSNPFHGRLCGVVKKSKWEDLRASYKRAYGDEHILTFANLGKSRTIKSIF